MSNTPQIIFVSVNNAKTKLGKLTATIHEHFAKGEKILVRLPDETACSFLDDYLWTKPDDSFIPHETTVDKSDEAIILTTADRNLNEASILVHLCPEPSAMPLRFQTLYDLKDSSTPEKLDLARKRYINYQERGFSIEIR